MRQADPTHVRVSIFLDADLHETAQAYAYSRNLGLSRFMSGLVAKRFGGGEANPSPVNDLGRDRRKCGPPVAAKAEVVRTEVKLTAATHRAASMRAIEQRQSLSSLIAGMVAEFFRRRKAA